MFNYVLKVDANNYVGYIMKQTDCAVAGKMPLSKAVEHLFAGGTPHASDQYGGYPITADDQFFFEGVYEDDDNEILLGGDGLPIPATDGKPKRRNKKGV